MAFFTGAAFLAVFLAGAFLGAICHKMGSLTLSLTVGFAAKQLLDDHKCHTEHKYERSGAEEANNTLKTHCRTFNRFKRQAL